MTHPATVSDIAERIATLPDEILDGVTETGQAEEPAADHRDPAAVQEPEMIPGAESNTADGKVPLEQADTISEAEGAGAQEETDSDDAAEEPETDSDETQFDVKVDGEILRVPLSELKNGYSRQSDYQRKTAELAQQRRAMEAAAESLQQQYLQSLDIALNLAGKIDKPDPELLDENSPRHAPDVYYRQREAYDAWLAKVDQISRDRQEVMQQQVQERTDREAAALQRAWPEMAVQGGESLVQDLLAGAQEYYAIEPGTLGEINDHRVILALRDGVAWRRAQQAAPKTQKALRAKPRVMKPGVKQDPGQARVQQYRHNRQRLKSSGRSEDMAAALLESGLLD